MRLLTRIARLAALPALAGLLMSAVRAIRSPGGRQVARQAINDPRRTLGLLAEPDTARSVLGWVRHDPNVRELARASIVFMPLRYAALGQAALWGARRVVRSPSPGARTGSGEPQARPAPPDAAPRRRPGTHGISRRRATDR